MTDGRFSANPGTVRLGAFSSVFPGVWYATY